MSGGWEVRVALVVVVKVRHTNADNVYFASTYLLKIILSDDVLHDCERRVNKTEFRVVCAS